jgi:hypothetical protein
MLPREEEYFLQAQSLESLKIGFGLFEVGKETLFSLELARMDAAATGFHADWMFQVKHLVIQQVLDGASRSVGSVEDAADDDGVVGRVVVAKHAARVVGAPGKRGAAQESVEEARVQRVEDLIEVVVVAGVGRETLAASGLSNVLGLSGDGFRGDMAAIAVGVGACDRLPVELREQDVRDSVMDGLGGVLENVGETDVKAALAQANRGVQRGETAEADVECGDRRTRTQFPVLVFEDGYERRGCRDFSGAGPFG